MVPELLVFALIAVVAVVVAVTVYRRAGERDAPAVRRAPQAHRPSPLGTLVDLIDGSIALYVIRERLGRSTVTRAERRAERARAEALAAEEAARWRLTPPDEPTAGPPTHLIVAGTAASRAPLERPRIQAHPTSEAILPAGHPLGRFRGPLGGDGVLVVAGVAVLLVAMAALWPRAAGGVLSAIRDPGPVRGATGDRGADRGSDRRTGRDHGRPDGPADRGPHVRPDGVPDADRHAPAHPDLATDRATDAATHRHADAAADRHPDAGPDRDARIRRRRPEPTPTPEPTAEPTPEPTAEPTPEPTPDAAPTAGP